MSGMNESLISLALQTVIIMGSIGPRLRPDMLSYNSQSLSPMSFALRFLSTVFMAILE